jgi:hypothetical protein
VQSYTAKSAPSEAEANALVSAYGLALFQAAAVEFSLVSLLAVAELSPGNPSSAAAAQAMAYSSSKLTFGQLLKEVRRAGLAPGIDAQLGEAVEGRNWLAHRFYPEAARQTASPRERPVLIATLRRLSGLFSSLDAQLQGILNTTMQDRGLSVKALRSRAEALLDHLAES